MAGWDRPEAEPSGAEKKGTRRRAPSLPVEGRRAHHLLLVGVCQSLVWLEFLSRGWSVSLDQTLALLLDGCRAPERPNGPRPRLGVPAAYAAP